MHTKWIVGLAMVASSIGVSAQQTSQTPNSAAPLPRGGNQTMSITGCVTQADTPGSFFLTNARMSNDSPTGTAQPSKEDPRNTPAAAAAAQTPSTASSATAMRYALHSTSDLKSHVGHQVEVTGRLASAAGSGSSAVGTSGTGASNPDMPTGNTGTAGTSGAGTTVPAATAFNVEAVRMIASTCTTP